MRNFFALLCLATFVSGVSPSWANDPRAHIPQRFLKLYDALLEVAPATPAVLNENFVFTFAAAYSKTRDAEDRIRSESNRLMSEGFEIVNSGVEFPGPKTIAMIQFRKAGPNTGSDTLLPPGIGQRAKDLRLAICSTYSGSPIATIRAPLEVREAWTQAHSTWEGRYAKERALDAAGFEILSSEILSERNGSGKLEYRILYTKPLPRQGCF